MRGFSPRNLKYMRSLAQAHTDGRIVQEVLAQITWYHNIALLEKTRDPAERLWYAHQTLQHGWSRNVLVHQIEYDPYHRHSQGATRVYGRRSVAVVLGAAAARPQDPRSSSTRGRPA